MTSFCSLLGPPPQLNKETIKTEDKINFKDLIIMFDLKLLIEFCTKIGKRFFMIHKLLLIFTPI